MNKNILIVKDFHISNIKVITVFLFIILNSVSFAAPKQEFGYVNVIDVMMLHPTMQYFDLGSKRFDLKAFKGINIKERIEQNKVRVRKEINKQKEQLDIYEDKIKEIQAIYAERKEHLLKPGERVALMTKTRRKMYEDQKADLEAGMYSEIAAVRRASYPTQQKIKRLEESSAYTGYSTEKETRELFNLMLDDVYEAINVVTKLHKLTFVFNSSACFEYIENKPNLYFEVTENRLSEFFSNYKKILKETDTYEASQVAGSQVTQWLDNRNTVFKNCLDRRLSNFVINGGMNITPEVIEYVYKKYKIDKEVQIFIKDYFEKIMLPGTEGHRDF